LEIILRCSGADKMSLAAIRTARHSVHKAGMKPMGKSLKCAQCLEHYAGPKLAMERSRVLAAAGLQDTAADVTCEALANALETKLSLAFISVDKWAVEGNDGKPVDLNSLDALLAMISASAIDLQMAMDQWSGSRIEDQTDNSQSFLCFDPTCALSARTSSFEIT
jgi:hypothetical protein